MNYEYYKIFYYVGKHKNITKAAAELYSSQPAVTRAIQNLEAELGCRLFIRNKYGVEFTHEGKTLYEYASVACNQLIKGEEEVSRSVSVESGTIYIGATVTSLHGFLFDFLDGFHLKYPKVKFQISTASSDKTIEKLSKGIIDLAFVTTPFHISRSLHCTAIREFNDILIAGNEFSRLKGKTLKMNDLKKYPFVCLEKGMQLRQFIDDIFADHNITLKPDIEPDSADLLIPMISHNFGLGFAPQGIAEKAIGRGEVFRISLDPELPPRNICLITDPHHLQTSASRELTKTIVSRYGK